MNSMMELYNGYDATMHGPIVQTGDRDGRAFDVTSLLVQNGQIFLTGGVNDHVSDVIVKSLLWCDAEKKPVMFTINSGGGSVSSGLAISDTMDFVDVDVATMVSGIACSMGSYLQMWGAKGKRFIMPSSRVMIHQPSSGTKGTVDDMRIYMDEVEKLKEKLTRDYAARTNLDYDTLVQMMGRDKWLSPEECKEYGMVDHIVASKKEMRGILTELAQEA